jgi:uncharacterized protein
MATALELNRQDWHRYKGGLATRERYRRLTPDEQRERDSLLARIKRLAEILKRDFGVKRVLLFGSLAAAPGFTLSSDVDLAVEGLEVKAYWRAWKLAEDMIGDRGVDFVDVESVSDSLKQSIERYGVEQ